MSAGKGDKPRNCFSKQYKDNFDQINWKSKTKNKSDTKKVSDFCGKKCEH